MGYMRAKTVVLTLRVETVVDVTALSQKPDQVLSRAGVESSQKEHLLGRWRNVCPCLLCAHRGNIDVERKLKGLKGELLLSVKGFRI